jgi:hypothetical protein
MTRKRLQYTPDDPDKFTLQEMTEEICVRAQEVDWNNKPDSSLCTGEKGRGGSVFCDEYAQLTGSRIAYGGCYDRNDNPRSYCDNYAILFYITPREPFCLDLDCIGLVSYLFAGRVLASKTFLTLRIYAIYPLDRISVSSI